MVSVPRRFGLVSKQPRGARRWSTRCLAVLTATAALVLVGASAAGAGAGFGGGGNNDGGGHGGAGHAFRQINLVSDIAGVARITDRNLVNPWGLAAGPNTPLWVADNGSDASTLYSGGVRGSIPVMAPLVVAIPGGAPTGAVFNPTSGFVVKAGTASAPARFIFDSEAGLITAWSPTVPPTTTAQTEATTPGAIYKGLAIAQTPQGTRLYATDFHGAKIDVFDEQFAPVKLAGSVQRQRTPGRLCPVRHPGAGRAPVRDLRQAGRPGRGRGPRPGARVRRRLRHQRSPPPAARLPGTAQRALGPRARATQLRRVRRRSPGRQLR